MWILVSTLIHACLLKKSYKGLLGRLRYLNVLFVKIKYVKSIFERTNLAMTNEQRAEQVIKNMDLTSIKFQKKILWNQ